MGRGSVIDIGRESVGEIFFQNLGNKKSLCEDERDEEGSHGSCFCCLC